jgi:hypothetical protein
VLTTTFDGSLSFNNPAAEDLACRILEAHDVAAQGAFTLDRKNDKLTRALGNKKHPGRTCGTNNVLWAVASQGHFGMYKSRGRRNAQ